MTRSAPRWHRHVLAIGLPLLVAACAPMAPGTGTLPDLSTPEEMWLVSRRSGAPTASPGAPALAARPVGSPESPTLLDLASTTVDAAVLGPVVTLTRHKRYRSPAVAAEGFVVFTPPAGPARQDLLLRVGGRTICVLIHDANDGAAVDARGRRVTHLVPEADGRVVAPIGQLTPRGTGDLTVETVGLAAWNDGGYELMVPRVPNGDVAMTIDLYGAGPVVVVSSPSHAIDAVSLSVDHLRVGLRVPISLHDQDFVLRYRIDAHDRAGVAVAHPNGTATLVGLVLHPHEIDHVPVGLSQVSVDWGAMHVLETRPPAPSAIAAGAPLVLLGRVDGAAPSAATITGKSAGRPRAFVLEPTTAAPPEALRALAVLWDRAGRGIGAR